MVPPPVVRKKMGQYERLREEKEDKKQAKKVRRVRETARRASRESWRSYRARARNRIRYQASEEGQAVVAAWKETKNAT